MTGAFEESLRGIEHELGVYSQGVKGATSRKTPAEIRDRCERLAIDSVPLVYASRMAAKVDSAAVQDGYQLYHHAFFFSAEEPHEAICSNQTAPALILSPRSANLYASPEDFVSERS